MKYLNFDERLSPFHFRQSSLTPTNLSQLRHGGKVAAGALALTAVIIYTYYESGRSKTAIEEGLNNRMIIEPYEINEIRFVNNLTPAVYEALSSACLNHFASSSSSAEQGKTSTRVSLSCQGNDITI